MVYVSDCLKQYTTQTLFTAIGLFHKYVNDTSCPLVIGFFVWWLSHSVDVFYEIIACFWLHFMSTLAPFTASASSFMGNCLGG